jgi:hypothetical protein
MNINIKINFTEINPNSSEGFRIPMSGSPMYSNVYRENGSTAKVVNFNRLIILTPYGCTKEYAVSFELRGNDDRKMWERDSDANIRFWRAVEAVVIARLNNIVRYINRHTW